MNKIKRRVYYGFPTFEQQHFPMVIALAYFGFILLWYITCKSESNNAQDTNAPFDDVTHWVGNLPRKDTHSTKRPVKRYSWWKIKSNILSSKLGMETKRED